MVQQAIGYWSRLGVTGDALASLDQVEVQIASLPGSLLGIASTTNCVWIDRDAAGYGWNAGLGSGGMDLLSAVTHEFGHKLGLYHDDPHKVMAAALARGVRSLPIPDPVESSGLVRRGPRSFRFDSTRADLGPPLPGMSDELFAALATQRTTPAAAIF